MLEYFAMQRPRRWNEKILLICRFERFIRFDWLVSWLFGDAAVATAERGTCWLADKTCWFWFHWLVDLVVDSKGRLIGLSIDRLLVDRSIDWLVSLLCAVFGIGSIWLQIDGWSINRFRFLHSSLDCLIVASIAWMMRLVCLLNSVWSVGLHRILIDSLTACLTNSTHQLRFFRRIFHAYSWQVQNLRSDLWAHHGKKKKGKKRASSPAFWLAGSHLLTSPVAARWAWLDLLEEVDVVRLMESSQLLLLLFF